MKASRSAATLKGNLLFNRPSKSDLFLNSLYPLLSIRSNLPSQTASLSQFRSAPNTTWTIPHMLSFCPAQILSYHKILIQCAGTVDLQLEDKSGIRASVERSTIRSRRRKVKVVVGLSSQGNNDKLSYSPNENGVESRNR